MFRTCAICHHSDFQDLMDKVSVRSYRHKTSWKRRCDLLKAHPSTTLERLIQIGLPGISYPDPEAV